MKKIICLSALIFSGFTGFTQISQLPESQKRDGIHPKVSQDKIQKQVSSTVNYGESASRDLFFRFGEKSNPSFLHELIPLPESNTERGAQPTVQAPANDACGSAINLGTVSTTTTTTGTNSGATSDVGSPSCYHTQKNVWYTFTVPAGGGTYTLSLTGGASFYPQMCVVQFSTPCTSAGSVVYACGGQCSSGTASTMTITASCLSAGTYYIMVDNDNSTGGIFSTPDCYAGIPSSFTLTVTQTATGSAPSNDNCSGVINLGTVSTSTSVAGTNYCATSDLWTPSCESATYNNVWYKFTVPAGGGSYSFTITRGTLTYPDIGIIQFSTACNLTGSTQAGCYDPATNADMTLNVNCMAAGTYYISVDDDAFGAPGTFTLTVTQNGSNNNDNCASAQALTLVTTNNSSANTVTYTVTATGNNACATADQASSSCWTNGPNLWYTFTPTVTGNFYFGVKAGTMSYPEVAIASGACGSLSYISCAGTTTVTGYQPYGYYSSAYTYAEACNLVSGTTYHVMVDSWSTAGSFSLTVASLSNDQIANAAIISNCGTNFGSSTIGATNCGNCVGNGYYNDEDCNSATTAPGNTSGADVPSGMSVENDSWYQFCSTANQTYSVTVTPVNCIGANAGTATELQMVLYTGSPSALTYVNGSTGFGSATTYTISLASGACGYIMVDGSSGTNCDYNVNLTASPGCPLPIELLSFSGDNIDNHKIKLEWMLAMEKDINYYLVEKSSDGKDYSSMVKVRSAGNTNQKGTYYAYDENPLNGYNYYRLSTVDINGIQTAVAYTMVTNKAHLPFLTVYPNPSPGKFNMSLANFSSENVSVEVYDAFGKKIFFNSATLTNGGSTEEIDLSEFGNGFYYIKVSDGSLSFHQHVIIHHTR